MPRVSLKRSSRLKGVLLRKLEPISWSPFTVSLVHFLVYILKSVSIQQPQEGELL